jgi:hypothetical protein
MKNFMLVLFAVILWLLASCTTADMLATGKSIWDQVDISYGKKDGEAPIDSMVISFEPVYQLIDTDTLIQYQDYHYDNGTAWMWMYWAKSNMILEGGGLDTVIYIYRKHD